MALLYMPDGKLEIVTPANGKHFTLPELQGMVGGYIEMVRTHSDAPMFVNEEGRLRGMDYNPAATAFYKFGHIPGNDIVGPAVICNDVEAGN